MNILMIGPTENNPTDGVIIRGIKYILNRNYPNHTYTYKKLDDINQQYMSDFYPYHTFNLIVVCGTPWLWDSFQNSQKYINLVKCFNTHPNAKRLFMGAGSCINLEDTDGAVLRRDTEQAGIKGLFEGATVIARDHLAQRAFTAAGIDSCHLPCPAYYCYGDSPNLTVTHTPKSLIIYTDPKQTISAINWQDTDKLDAYNEEVMSFFNNYDADVYCAFPNEVEAAIAIGLPTPKVLIDSADTLETMRQYTNVLSGRVHCAVPALMAGCSVKLMPLDSRYLVVDNFINSFDYDGHLKMYDKVLKGIFNA